MAQLKDLIVNGASRLVGPAYTDNIQITTLNALTTAGGSSYGPGTNGYVLKSNGSSIYWGEDNNTTYTFEAGSSALSWDTEVTLATVGDLDIKAKLPAQPTDTKVTQAAALTTTGQYPVILGHSTTTVAVTNTVNKSANFTYNPAIQRLILTGKNNNGVELQIKRGDAILGVGFDSNNTNHGIYHYGTNAKWIAYSDANGNVTLNGNASTATTAGYATTALNALHAMTAHFASSANTATTAGYATTALNALHAMTAHFASTATKAGSANYAARAGNVYYGTCTTASATTAKVVTCTDYAALTAGDVLYVKFSYTNSGAADDLTLNVNGKGAKPLRYQYNSSVSAIPGVSYIIGNQTYAFTYDGTNWITRDIHYNTNTNTINTAGAANSTKKLFLVGATVQSSTVTYSNTAVYMTNGKLTATTFTGALDGTAETALTVTRRVYQATAVVASWTGSGPYTNTTTAVGVVAADVPIIDINLSNVTFANVPNYLAQYGYIYRVTTAANKITLYATAKPTVALPIQIRCQ